MPRCLDSQPRLHTGVLDPQPELDTGVGIPNRGYTQASAGHVAKISMLRLNIGSGKLSSCMLSIGRGPKAVQGKGGGLPPLALFAFGSEANAEHA